MAASSTSRVKGLARTVAAGAVLRVSCGAANSASVLDAARSLQVSVASPCTFSCTCERSFNSRSLATTRIRPTFSLGMHGSVHRLWSVARRILFGHSADACKSDIYSVLTICGRHGDRGDLNVVSVDDRTVIRRRVVVFLSTSSSSSSTIKVRHASLHAHPWMSRFAITLP